MARNGKNYTLNSPASLISTILFFFLVVPIILFIFRDLIGDTNDVLLNLIDILPFGEGLYWLTLQLVGAMAGEMLGIYSLTGVFTASYIIQELSIGIFTVIIYEAMALLCFKVMGLMQSTRGRWNGMKRVVVRIAMAVLAACLAPIPLNYIFTTATGTVKTVVSSLISAILLGGGVSFFTLLMGLTLGKAILFVAIKFLVLGFLRLGTSYVCLFLILVAFREGIFGLMLGGASGLLGVLIILAGLDLLLSKTFHPLV